MSTPAPIASLPSLGAFLGADPRRDLRTEVSVGDWWLGDGFPAPAWRAAWIPKTEELYVQRLGGAPPGGRVTVLARLTEAELAERLDGWEAVCGTIGSVAWLAERLAGGDAAPAGCDWASDA